MIGEFSPSRTMNDSASAFCNSSSNFVFCRLRYCSACAEHKFDFNSNEFAVRSTIDNAAKVIAVARRHAIARPPWSDVAKLQEEIAPRRVVCGYGASALPSLPKRDDFLQRAKLWHEKIKLGISVGLIAV